MVSCLSFEFFLPIMAVTGGALRLQAETEKQKTNAECSKVDRIAPRPQTKKWHTVDVLLTNKYAKQMLRQCLPRKSQV